MRQKQRKSLKGCAQDFASVTYGYIKPIVSQKGIKRHKLHLDFQQSGAYELSYSGLLFNNVIVLVNSDTKSLNRGLSLLIINAA